MRKKQLLAVALLFCSLSIAGQEKAVHEKLIPIVEYSPNDFMFAVRKAFHRLPHTDYIRVVEQEEHYHVNLGLEERRVMEFAFPIRHIPGLMTTDSLFMFDFHERPIFYAYRGKVGQKYYGVVKDGKITFGENQKGGRAGLSLNNIIHLEYGSLRKFKESLNYHFNRNIDENIRNGIFDINNKKAAIAYLQKDYEFYSACFPEDEEGVFELFFAFIRSKVKCTPFQVARIKQMVKEDRNRPEAQVSFYEPYYERAKKVNLFGRNISYILFQVLEADSYLTIISENEKRKKLKYNYLENGALYLEPYDIGNGDKRIPTPEEGFEYAKKEVFGNGN